MATTIRNPIEWSADQLKSASHHLGEVHDHLAVHETGVPQRLNRIGIEDLRQSLREGVADFAACRSDVMLLCVLYPVIGLMLAWAAFDLSLLPLLFPAMAGFALIGPAAAVGLYEMSRRREQGREAGWADAFGVLASPSFGAIFVLTLLLVAIFMIWMLVAGAIHALTMGGAAPDSIAGFAAAVLSTPGGWAMIVLGCGVGALFAGLVLAISAISYPLLLDRNVGLPAAIVTSVRATAENPRTMAIWGLIVAAGLVLGSIPAFLGLIVVMPVLGHATWHLYRKIVPHGR